MPKKILPNLKKRARAATVIQAAIRDDDEQWLECWHCHKGIRINSEEHDNVKICEFPEGDVLFCIDCREYCDTSESEDSDDE